MPNTDTMMKVSSRIVDNPFQQEAEVLPQLSSLMTDFSPTHFLIQDLVEDGKLEDGKLVPLQVKHANVSIRSKWTNFKTGGPNKAIKRNRIVAKPLQQEGEVFSQLSSLKTVLSPTNSPIKDPVEDGKLVPLQVKHENVSIRSKWTNFKTGGPNKAIKRNTPTRSSTNCRDR